MLFHISFFSRESFYELKINFFLGRESSYCEICKKHWNLRMFIPKCREFFSQKFLSAKVSARRVVRNGKSGALYKIKISFLFELKIKAKHRPIMLGPLLKLS